MAQWRLGHLDVTIVAVDGQWTFQLMVGGGHLVVVVVMGVRWQQVVIGIGECFL